MKCPECKVQDTKVIESRDLEDGESIRRRRECLKCGFRFTTYERVEKPVLVVVKKDGRRELFNREKLGTGIYKSCEKRPISQAKIEGVISEIEKELRTTKENEIQSSEIGDLVMNRLKSLDDVAYIRFASVYKSFGDLDSFKKELESIRWKKKIKSK